MRYFCHHCHRQIPADELLPEFTCPSCHSGFIEEMPNVASTTGTGPTSSRRNSGSNDLHHHDGLAGFISTRMSSEELSDDNSDVEFLDAVNGPLAQFFNSFQPQLQAAADDLPGQSANQPDTSSSETQQNQTPQQANRRITRSSGRIQGRVPGAPRLPLRPTEGSPAASYSTTNQSLADVLNDFMTGASFGTQYPEGSSAGLQAAGGSNSLSANRGLINIDFPIPFFLHSNPGDYAWGNAGFDAVITQLLNNLDGSNTGPPPMPDEQVENLPTVKISDEQVKNTNLQCTVCMDDFQVGDSARQLPCEHFFHQDCILPWLKVHASCPICRKTFATGANAAHNMSSSDPHSETDRSNISANASLINRSTNGPPATTATTATTAPATPSTTTRNTTTSTANQSSAPKYDYTEDDCD